MTEFLSAVLLAHTPKRVVLDFAAVCRCCGLWARRPWPQAVLIRLVYSAFFFMNLGIVYLRCTRVVPLLLIVRTRGERVLAKS